MSDTPDTPIDTADPAYLEPGTAAFRSANIALSAAGFATFSSLYSVQPLMPLFSDSFGISPAASSLSLSITTAVLAFSIFIAGLMSEAIDRKRLMALSLIGSSLLSLAAAFAPGWGALLAARALEGIVLGGVPALAIAYLAEETRPSALGFAMGLYVSGTALGGMAGRVISGVAADLGGWRAAMAAMAVIGFIATLVFIRLLPASRHFQPRPGLSMAEHLAPIGRHLRHGALPWVFTIGFLLMGGFVAVYNYMPYRLAEGPYFLSQSAIGAVFVVYLLGIVASTTFGRLADRHGRARMLLIGLVVMILGLALTLATSLALLVVGIGLITLGFFASHAIASGWVGQLAQGGKGQAAGLYLLSYYLGSSLVGVLGGLFWAELGWPGVVALVAALLAIAFVAVFRLWVWQRNAPSV